MLAETCLLTDQDIYNSSKPDKYSINFSYLCKCIWLSCWYFPHWCVSGKIENETSIPQELWNFPTKQKAVVNEIISTRVYKFPNGFQELFLDDRYLAPELFILLKMQYKIIVYGTICTNRKEWDKFWWIFLKCSKGVCQRKIILIWSIQNCLVSWKTTK